MQITISEVSTEKLQDMPTVIRGITKIAEVHTIPSEDYPMNSEDQSNISEDFMVLHNDDTLSQFHHEYFIRARAILLV